MLLLLAWLFLPMDAAAIVGPAGGGPDGVEAVGNVATFAMVYPGRAGEGPLMDAARDELARRLEEMGYDVERQQYMGSNPGVNVVGILRGQARPHDWIVVGAHYDVAITPANGVGASPHGAWDNGAGVAAALEIARVAAQREWNATIAIAFFDDEEGGIVGSPRFVSGYDGRAWEGGTIRLLAGINLDPPGLNWPCIAHTGVVMPVTLAQWRGAGAGATRLRELAFAARVAEGVPDEAFEFYGGSIPIAYVLSGVSDHVAFGNRGVPDLYVGSSTHLRFANAVTVQTVYPLHTPADDLATMVAYCGGNPLNLARAFEVEMRIVWRVMQGIDADAAWVRP